MNNNYQEMFHDAGARSTNSQRFPPQGLHRQGSRQFEGYNNPMPTHSFGGEDRFEPSRFDRTNGAMGNGGFSNFEGGSQTWNPNAFGGPFNTFGLSRTMRPNTRSRTNLPQTWLDQPVPPMPNISQLGGIGQSVLGNNQGMRNDPYMQEQDDELIPTAIVIKNIPFAVKKEQLVELMTSMALPLPYAFNYHFDNGVFRGLAFANFTSPDETSTVIEHLNHFELHGRKLRVEYKRMLPQQERERIEREKRERRGQLEEQHRPLAGPNLHNQQSISSLSSHIPATSPSPVSSRGNGAPPNVNLNDPETLQFYNELLMFRNDKERESIIFPATLSASQRRLVHTIGHLMGLGHESRGNGEQRQVHVFRGDHVSPLLQQGVNLGHDPNRRTLNRSATTDFAESRQSEPTPYAGLRGQQSSGFLGIPDSPGGFLGRNDNNLRGAKSFADLRSYTPSPAQSTASFPVNLQSNIARFQDNGLGTASSNTPTLNAGGHSHENLITNGLAGLSLGGTIGAGGSPRRGRIGMPWDDAGAPTAPIGSNRTSILPSRQPRGPAVERGQGFAARARQNGHQPRGSDELRQQTSSNLAQISAE